MPDPNSDADMRVNLWWQWERHQPNMLGVLGSLAHHVTAYPEDPKLSAAYEKQDFDEIRRGQAHNPPVANAYEVVFDADPERFWMLTVTATKSTVRGDLAGLKLNVDWQAQNHRATIKQAQQWFTSPDIRYPKVIGMHFLMSGQQHNAAVMELYRATFRDSPREMWDYINGIL